MSGLSVYKTISYIDDDAIANQYWVSSAIEYFNNNRFFAGEGSIQIMRRKYLKTFLDMKNILADLMKIKIKYSRKILLAVICLSEKNG